MILINKKRNNNEKNLETLYLAIKIVNGIENILNLIYSLYQLF